MLKESKKLDLSEHINLELNAIIDALDDIIFVHDENYNITRANAAYANKAKKNFKEIIGQPFWKIFPITDTPEKFCTYHIEESEKISLENKIELSSGEIYRNRSFITTNNHLKPACVHILEDITDQEKSKQQLKDSIEQFQAISATVHDVILVLNHKNEISFTNQSIENMFGYKQSDIINQSFFKLLLPSPILESYKKYFDECYQNGVSHLNNNAQHLIALHKDGHKFSIEMVISPIKFHNQWHALCVIHDITKQKEAEAKLSYQLQFDHLISNISKYLAAIQSSELDKAINYSLYSIGTFVNIDRSYIFLYSPENNTFSNSYEWCQKDIPPLMYESQEISVNDYPWLINNLNSGESVLIADFAQLPPEAKNIKKFMKIQKIKSRIVVPLVQQGKVFGFLGFDSIIKSRNWSKTDILLLLTVSELLSQAFSKKWADEAQVESAKKLKEALIQTIQAISQTIEKRDPYTAGHQQRVSKLATTIATELALPERQIEGIQFGALIHDIGKIYIPSEILNRPGKLTDTEMELVMTHPQVGYDILKDIDLPWPVAQMVLQHHERLDGSGYPHGLKKEQIPIEAQILAVADVVEAITSHRPYRPALEIDHALDELRKNKDILYNGKIVDACIKLFKEKGFNF